MEDDEHLPLAPAPRTGHYEELNVFGTPTGKVVHVEEGRELRAASRGGIQERRSIGGRPRIAESGPRGLPPVRYRLVGGAAMSDDTDLRDVLRAMIAVGGWRQCCGHWGHRG
jgi:hypothetical protein